MLHLSATLFSRKERQLCIAQTVEKNFRLNVNSAPGAVPRLPDPKIIPALRKTTPSQGRPYQNQQFPDMPFQNQQSRNNNQQFQNSNPQYSNSPFQNGNPQYSNSPFQNDNPQYSNSPFQTAIKHIRIQYPVILKKWSGEMFRFTLKK